MARCGIRHTVGMVCCCQVSATNSSLVANPFGRNLRAPVTSSAVPAGRLQPVCLFKIPSDVNMEEWLRVLIRLYSYTATC